jgi:hypothetical protein
MAEGLRVASISDSERVHVIALNLPVTHVWPSTKLAIAAFRCVVRKATKSTRLNWKRSRSKVVMIGSVLSTELTSILCISTMSFTINIISHISC